MERPGQVGGHGVIMGANGEQRRRALTANLMMGSYALAGREDDALLHHRDWSLTTCAHGWSLRGTVLSQTLPPV